MKILSEGPNELSIRDASAIQPVLGPGGLPKGPWWAHWPNVGPVLIGMRHTGEHARRRRPWNRAFTGSALKDYEDIVTKRSRQLAERLDGLIHSQGELPGSGAVLDLGAWLSYFATDLMGDMAFGGGFELVRDGRDTEGVWAIMKSGLRASAICAHASWIFHFIKLAPSLQRRVAGLQEFATKSVTRRMEIGAWRKDLFFHLSDEEKHESVAPTFEELAADGILAIVAGADTSATVLTAFFWYLLQNPGAYQRLQQEVDNTFSGGEEITDAVKLSQMEWLNGCINEACRLQPPLPSGTQRSVGRGKGPKVIGTNVIPDETQIFVHTYSVQRDPRNFTSPDSFLPERWLNPLPKEISTHNTAAFFPFSYGPANCAGKNLALLQMRTVICWLMQRFELQRANDHKLPRLEEWADGLQDFYVMGKGPLWVRAVRRN
ncbi:cytochrome P450 [Artomyces pyxidatus]|uniref:Cytochrome P450 n=1 Tax=Artomyces pyxidatus TaxID=48021 RepID=A0ACB8TH97_9AGAM|nr:cytochrome P450 [Artomyces pyxidatus]